MSYPPGGPVNPYDGAYSQDPPPWQQPGQGGPGQGDPYGPPMSAYSPYGAYGPYGGMQSSVENGKGSAALVMGILSLVLCFIPLADLVLGVLAIVKGTQGRAAAARGTATNRGAATAGMVLGIIAVVLALIYMAGAVSQGLGSL